jgi:hypothetical protein
MFQLNLFSHSQILSKSKGIHSIDVQMQFYYKLEKILNVNQSQYNTHIF